MVILAIIAGVLTWRMSRKAPAIGEAYAGESKVTLWSSTAQVREAVETVAFGEPLSILEKSGDNFKVRLMNGKEATEGWVAAHDLIDSKLWMDEQDLTKHAEGMETQAAAHTKAAANLRTEPGRDSPRFYQLDHDVPVGVLKRKVLDVPMGTGAAGQTAAVQGGKEKESEIRTSRDKDANPRSVLADNESTANVPTRKEDWLLVLATTKDTGSLKHVAGWVLARFVDMDLPDALTSYASAEGMRVMGWEALNNVPDHDGTKSQYLVFGTKGPEGNLCDFTTFRVFTWDTKRQKYETAYVESGFCGMMPMHCETASKTGGDANFHFSEIDDNGKEHRVHYHLHQTKIRRVGSTGPEAEKSGR